MDASSAIRSYAKSLRDVLSLGRFEPASVQREFQWTSSETERLLDDLLTFMRRHGFEPADAPASAVAAEGGGASDAYDDGFDAAEADVAAAEVEADDDDLDGDEAGDDDDGVAAYAPRPKPAPSRNAPQFYFLGAIVFNPVERSEGLYRIYDGLQRITTLSILLAVLRDGWRDLEAEQLAVIEELLGAGEYRRLRAPSKGGSLALILNRSPRRLADGASNADACLAEARDVLSARLQHWRDEERATFLELLLSRVIVTETIIANRSTAYQVFVGANARGKRLDLGDVLKGKLIELIDRPRPGNGEKYARAWAGLQRNFRDRFGDLLKDAEFIRYKEHESYHPGELIIADIDAEERSETVAPERLADDWSQWIEQDLDACAKAFRRIRAHYGPRDSVGADIALRQLSFLDWDEWRPIAMAFFLRSAKGGPSRASQMRKLQQTCYILELVDWSEDGRRKIAADAIAQIESGRDPFEHRFPEGEPADYGALRPARSIQDKAWARLDSPLVSATQRGAVTRWIETLHWGKRLPNHCTNDADVEHVLPQALKGGWERDFDAAEHERWRHRLGNLCIIPKTMNYDLQTEPWSEKRPAYRSLGDRFKGAEIVAASEAWTPADVERRHRALLQRARQALGLRRPVGSTARGA